MCVCVCVNLVEIFSGKECLVTVLMKLCSKRVRLCCLLPCWATAVAWHSVVDCSRVMCVLACQYWWPTRTTQWTCNKLLEQNNISSSCTTSFATYQPFKIWQHAHKWVLYEHYTGQPVLITNSSKILQPKNYHLAEAQNTVTERWKLTIIL